MEGLFITLYRFFKTHRTIFWSLLVLVLAGLSWMASRITLEEDITRFFPDDKRVRKLNYIFQHSPMAERVVVMVSVKDSSRFVPVDSLSAVADRTTQQMTRDLASFNAKVTGKIDDTKILSFFDMALEELPVFLTEEDYLALDSIASPRGAASTLQKNYRNLISPSGMVYKQVLVRDPMGFSFLVLKKLQQLQYDDNFQLYDNFIITRDHRHMLFFVMPENPSNETGKNKAFVQALDSIVGKINLNNPDILVSYFGATSVAVGNANQLRGDTMLTLGILGVLLVVIVFVFFRDWRALPLIFVPVAFGGLFALACIFLIKGSVSILALAAGSVILGIAVNYSLHFLVHQRYHPDKEEVIRDLVKPMTLGSLTTVLAFFCLQFTNAAVLKDIGLFAGFSLIGAALSSLLILPQLAPEKGFSRGVSPEKQHSVQRKSPKKLYVIIIFVLTPVFFYFAGDVSFNSDMNKLNFMSAESKLAQGRLEKISPASLHTMFVTSDGKSLEESLRNDEKMQSEIDELLRAGKVQRYQGVSSLLISDSLQQVRIDRWVSFWTPEKKKLFLDAVHAEGARLRFSPAIISRIDSMLARRYYPMKDGVRDSLIGFFFTNNVIRRDTATTIVSLINVLPEHKPAVHAALDKSTPRVFDRNMITSLFVHYIHDDFIFIVTFTSILVFSILLISIGRIELTMVTFTPMMITWIWILGIMALLGIEFNIVNVMISTFIFGLGDDYSIFVMDGLVQEYRTGKQNLASVRKSILLSALATICGLGVLIFAGHPALRSIAAISIIGIVCVFVMSQTIEPFLFDWLITSRTRRKLQPRTLKGMFFTFVAYFLFVSGSFLLSIVGLIFKLIPIYRREVKWFYHRLLSYSTWTVMYATLNLKKSVIYDNTDVFKRPGIIIANHSSFLDILTSTMVHPKIILLTNKWVYNSPIFGAVVRLADYYSVTEGAEESIEQLRNRVDEGYSIVVFPEGTRSPDGEIRRFHKGAFFLAEKLNLPIYPLLIHGPSGSIPKSTMYVGDAHITLKFLPAIEADDSAFGKTYAERAKNIGRFFRAEYEKLHADESTPKALSIKLINNYLYKGPVLEWYLRIKVRLENYYTVFDDLVPKNAKVLDLGCGYGFLSYMLSFRSDERVITGVDYDQDKIDVADHGYLKSEKLNFYCDDLATMEIESADVMIIADVLHYLPEPKQFAVLARCFNSLNDGGKIIVRDGDQDLVEKHKRTRITELFSVSILKFNKSETPLQFVSGRALTTFAASHGFDTTVVPDSRVTSNRIFVMTRKK